MPATGRTQTGPAGPPGTTGRAGPGRHQPPCRGQYRPTAQPPSRAEARPAGRPALPAGRTSVGSAFALAGGHGGSPRVRRGVRRRRGRHHSRCCRRFSQGLLGPGRVGPVRSGPDPVRSGPGPASFRLQLVFEGKQGCRCSRLAGCPGWSPRTASGGGVSLLQRCACRDRRRHPRGARRT